MGLLVDSGALFAAYDRSDAWHKRTLSLLRREAKGLVVPALVLPEVDHLLGKRIGSSAQRLLRDDIAHGTYLIHDLSGAGYRRVVEIDRQFSDLRLDLADLAVVVVAEETGVRRVATTDRRDFDPLAAALGLNLLP